MTFDDYLQRLKLEVRKHGRSGLRPMILPNERCLGFSSPDGEWLIQLSVLRAACDPGQPKVILVPPGALGVDQVLEDRKAVSQDAAEHYSERVEAAITEGERLRRLDKLD